MPVIFDPLSGNLIDIGNSATSVAVGDTVTGGNPDSVIIVNSTNQIATVPLTNGQLVIGSSTGVPAAGSIAATAGHITVTPGANTITLSLPNTTVTPGSYTNTSITVDAQGRLTTASSYVDVSEFRVGPGRDYTTIQAALNAIGNSTTAADVKKPKLVTIAGGMYDENLTIPTGRIITLLAEGTVILGDGAGANWASTTPRSITASYETADVFGSDIRPALNLISIGKSDATSTFIAEASNFRISGNLNISGALTRTVNLGSVLIDGTITQGGAGLTNLQTYRSIFKGTITGNNIILERCYDCQFDALISIDGYNSIINSEIKAGMTVVTNYNTLPPSGILFTTFTGTFTGPANSLKLDLTTDYFFRTNGAILGGAATKVLLASNSSATVTGPLSSTDWSTFNNKQNALTFGDLTSSDITIGTGTGAVIGSGTTLTLNTVSIAKGGTGQTTQALGFDALSPTTTVGDIIYHNGTNNTRLAGNTSTSIKVLQSIGDGVNASAPSWQPLAASGLLTFMFADIASDVPTYLQMPSLSSYTAGTLGTATQTVTTTPTLLATFATNTGFPNITSIPVGLFVCHFETQKLAGANNYYTYYEVYKRAAGGTETLLLTSDNSSQSALNTTIQNTLTASNNANITLLATDRIVVKIYAVMVSSSASISLFYDDNTDSRLQLPSATVDATNFVPYTGATSHIDIGSKNLTTTGTLTGVVTGNLITGFVSGAGTVTATDTILQAVNKLDGNIATKVTTVTGDIVPTTWAGLVNNTATQTITGLSFSTSIKTFECLMNIYIDATTDLFTSVKIIGTRKALADWTTNDCQVEFTGDAITGLNFSIDSTGQVLIDIGNITGFSSGSIKFRASAL